MSSIMVVLLTIVIVVGFNLILIKILDPVMFDSVLMLIKFYFIKVFKAKKYKSHDKDLKQ